MIQRARDVINSEIKMAYGKAEGIKADQSFHQHGPQQQAGNYGAAYLATMSFWAYILDDTSLALEQEHFKIISDYVNTGVRRILWKNKMDINNLGRQLYRQAQRHKGFSTLFSVNTLAGINSNNNNVYQALINENLGRTPVGLLGQYHFWKSDITIHRCSDWMASLRMASDRVIGTESGTDNVKGYYLADGALYTYVDGEEYTDEDIVDYIRIDLSSVLFLSPVKSKTKRSLRNILRNYIKNTNINRTAIKKSRYFVGNGRGNGKKYFYENRFPFRCI